MRPSPPASRAQVCSIAPLRLQKRDNFTPRVLTVRRRRLIVAFMDRDTSSSTSNPIGARLLFTVATVLALVNDPGVATADADRQDLDVGDRDGQLLVLNFALHVPAALAPVVMAITRQYRLGRRRGHSPSAFTLVRPSCIRSSIPRRARRQARCSRTAAAPPWTSTGGARAAAY